MNRAQSEIDADTVAIVAQLEGAAALRLPSLAVRQAARNSLAAFIPQAQASGCSAGASANPSPRSPGNCRSRNQCSTSGQTSRGACLLTSISTWPKSPEKPCCLPRQRKLRTGEPNCLSNLRQAQVGSC